MMAFALCLLCACVLNSQAQTPAPTPSPCVAPTACPTFAPHGLQLQVSWKNKNPVTRKPFYLSPCAFNLAKLPVASTAPSRKSYYTGKASPQLIKWLEDNNCDTVYCRPLEEREVTCSTTSDKNCVPEFVQAYNLALAELKNKDRARKWITNYEPLSKPELRTGFYEKKKEWLKATIVAIEDASKLKRGTIRTATTDKNGQVYFYDLCPGTYYISNVAPAEIGSDRIIWETTAIAIEESETLTKKSLTDLKRNLYTITLVP